MLLWIFRLSSIIVPQGVVLLWIVRHCPKMVLQGGMLLWIVPYGGRFIILTYYASTKSIIKSTNV